MRNKIDYGIDLGTTNSAIARIEDGVPVIKKTDTLKDTLPSCVHFNKKGDCLVGDMAVNVMKNDHVRALRHFEQGKTNTFSEFKRTMGTTHRYTSPHLNKELKSEELSAEVLKRLRGIITDEDLNSVVITVPAKFLNPQNEATMRAAKLAGFKNVLLLQEPIAAATAYGLTQGQKDGYWLVFDLGGGTFDVALVKSEQGMLSVKDTDGDSWLGGKNIDELIIDQLLIPHLQSNYALDTLLSEPHRLEMLRHALKPFAEEAKIQLSYQQSYNILSNFGDLPFTDAKGQEPELDLLITQADLEYVTRPLFQQTIDITLNLLQRNNLTPQEIITLILVGGATFSPILRKMLREQIGEQIDYSIDAMTVVAKGAALFASTVNTSAEEQDAAETAAHLQLELKYESSTVELDELINIRPILSNTESIKAEDIYVEIERADGAWISPRTQLSDSYTLFEVLLNASCSNSFRIKTYDSVGTRLTCEPSQFSILQGIGGLESLQILPYHIGISKHFISEGKDLFHPIKGLEKNKKVPAIGVINGLKTRRSISPGLSNDIIRIPIYQGDYGAPGSNPIHNSLINEVIISGEHLPGHLPVGSEVDITIKVDQSQIMRFSAYFPSIDHTEELQIDIKETTPPESEALAEEIVKALEIAQKLGIHQSITALLMLLEELKKQSGSADGKMRLLESLRKELFKLEIIENENEWDKVAKLLQKIVHDFDTLIAKVIERNLDKKLNMDYVRQQAQENHLKMQVILQSQNRYAAKELISAIDLMDYNLRNIVTDNAITLKSIKNIKKNFNSIRWKDAEAAKQLIHEALNGAADHAPQIMHLLMKLIPPADQEKFSGTLS